MYLDNASTTKVKPEVIDAMMPYLEEKWHNPSSLYSDATYAKIAVDDAMNAVADLIGSKLDEIYFTSGGSESNCWAIQGFVNNRLAKHRVPVVITTDIEHKSIIECVKNLSITVTYFLHVDNKGFIDIEELEGVIKEAIDKGAAPKDILISIQFANNEIGTIQDVARIGSLAHLYGCVFHTDAVQAFGHLWINVDTMGIDMLSASAHKIGGPKGTGVLYIRKNVDIHPLIYGSQMDGMRGGTENVAGIVGMAKAVKLLGNYLSDNEWTSDVRDDFIDMLENIGCRLNGPRGKNRLPNNINVILPYNINGETLLYSLDVDDIQIGTGSACNSRSIEPSHVLKAIGLTDDEASKCIRITIDSDFADYDTDYVVEAIEKSLKVLNSINETEIRKGFKC